MYFDESRIDLCKKTLIFDKKEDLEKNFDSIENI
jgi:hypothetical protein